MTRTGVILLALVVLAGCTSATADPVLTDIGSGLEGPARLAATVYATDLANVSAFAFDADGRLWAATAAYDDAGTDAVYLIASAGSTPVKVIGALHTPLGLVWANGTLYVASAGRVDGYSGLTDTAFATPATVITLPAGVGEVNGLVLSPGGRLVLGVSAPCDACTPTTEFAAAVVSFLPDGSDLRVEAGGIRAPVGLAYVPGTTDLLVTMNQRDDLGEATPGDWLAVAQAGQAWGFPDCFGQGGAACDGVPTPVAVLDKHAAVAGIAIVTGQLGDDIGTSALVAEWATGKVMRVALTDDGDAYSGVAAPFITGLKNPVPIALAPDGVVLVGDWGTGTIYRIAAT
jgi:glucose/arabinose dehydrogenase